jgi:nucleotide-binding universal stress UspA family protein
MTFATLMTHVQPEPEAAPRLGCAVDLARRFGARLIGVGVEMFPPLAFDEGFLPIDAEWAVAMRKTVEEQLHAAHEAFRRQAAGLPDGDTIWLAGMGLPTPALAAASRAADLVILGGGPRRAYSPYRDCIPAELAMQAGRPVLVAPPGAPSLAARKIVVAWKDTREARRALSDSPPFLAAAAGVLVLEVCDKDDLDEAGTEDVVAALRRRGAAAEAKVTLQAHAAASQHIVEEADAFGADLIVLGCYGHSRLGEWVFGGVTHDLLAQDDTYLLLSH